MNEDGVVGARPGFRPPDYRGAALVRVVRDAGQLNRPAEFRAYRAQIARHRRGVAYLQGTEAYRVSTGNGEPLESREAVHSNLELVPAGRKAVWQAEDVP